MRPIPLKTRKEIKSDPFYKTCARAEDGSCQGRITIEHALIYAGRQINEKWALIPLCEYHHAVDKHQDGGDLNKEKNIWIALNRATNEQLHVLSKAINYIEYKKRLNDTYGFPPCILREVLQTDGQDRHVSGINY